MNLRAPITRSPRKAGRGFSLVELLLAVSLLLLLLGALAFNFATLQHGSRLQEGANQLEALLRFARAHAASTGHRVRITFEEDAGGLFVPLGNLDVSWEPDPLGEPDHFAPLLDAAPMVASVLDLVSVELVRPAGAASAFPSPSLPGSASAQDANASPPPSRIPSDEAPVGFGPITFLPDGSSDSAEITIAPRDDNGEDPHRLVLRLIGLTGSIRRTLLADETADGPAQPAPTPAPATGASGPIPSP